MSQGQPLAFFISKFTDPNYQSRISVGILNSEVEPAISLFLSKKTISCKTSHHYCTITPLHQTQITSNKIQPVQIRIRIKLRGVDKIDFLPSRLDGQDIFGAAYAKNRIQEILILFDEIYQLLHRFTVKQIELIDIFNDIRLLTTIIASQTSQLHIKVLPKNCLYPNVIQY